ncbi:MAG: CpaD family pilus assembly protein [Rhodospirillales bacterium]|nr:CpaD family pilus assembly protein [Rhodospirillales bacterium]
MHRTANLLRRSAGLAALALLVGCGGEPGLVPYAEWKQLDPPPRLEVRDAPIVHAVNFESGSTQLSETERGAVAGFLAAEDVGPGERVMLEAPSAGPEETDRIAQRLASLRSALEEQGVSVAMAPPAAPGTLGPDQIRLIASSATAVNPDCPGYNEPVSSFDRFGRPNMNLGCSNEINLGLMVADPNDLVRGRPLAPADAERSALAVQKYRTGTEGEDGGEGATSTLSVMPLAIGGGTGGGTQ